MALALIAGAYLMVNGLINDKATLAADLTESNTLLDLEEAKTKKLKEDLNKADTRVTDLNTQLAMSRALTQFDKRTLRGHDFEKILTAKPGLVGKRMRDATARMSAAIEEASRGEHSNSVPATAESR